MADTVAPSGKTPYTSASGFWGLTWAHFLNDGLANYLPGVLPVLVLVRHVPTVFAGGLMTALLLGQGLQPLSGWWADRLGGNRLILTGIVLSTLSAGLVGWARPLWLIIILLLLTGIGNTLFHPQALSVARGLARRREGIQMSTFLVGGELGRGLGPIAAGWIVSTFGLTQLWWLVTPLVVTWVPLVRTIPPSAQRRPQRPHVGIHWRDHAVPALGLVLFASLRAGAIYTVVTLAPLRWHAQGGSIVAGAGLVTTLITVGVIGNLAGGTFSDRFGRHAVLWVSTLASIALLIGYVMARGLWVWPILGLLGIALFSTSSTTLLIGQDIFSENPGLGSGIALGLANGVGALLVFPLTYVAGAVSFSVALWILIALTAASISALWVLPRTRSGILAA